jgi:hypothetical protein
MPKEQRYDPKKQQEIINQTKEQRLEEELELRRQAKEGKESIESSRALREHKARHTDVKRAQVFKFK